MGRGVTAAKVACILSILWVLTGGLVVDRRDDFTGADFRVGDGLAGYASFRPHKTEFQIPFLLWYSQAGPPYTLLFDVTDSDVRGRGQFWRMEVSDARVEYTDAQTYRKTDELRCIGRPGIPHAVGSLVIAGVGCDIEALVLRPVSHRIALKGWVENRSGERIQFSAAPEFVATQTLTVGPLIWFFFLQE